MHDTQPATPTHSKEKVSEEEAGLGADNVAISSKEERRLLRKFDCFLLPPLAFMCMLYFHL